MEVRSFFVFLRTGSFFLNKAALRFSEVFPPKEESSWIAESIFPLKKFRVFLEFSFSNFSCSSLFFVSITECGWELFRRVRLFASLLIISGSGYFLIIYPPPFLFEKFHHGEL